MPNTRFINPPTIAKAPGYTHAVETAAPGRTIYIAGQLGFDVHGKLAEGFRGQTQQAFENLKAALAGAGAGVEHLVRINNYLVDITQNIGTFREIRDQNLNMAAPPASTAIGVPALARDGALFEIDAIAFVPA
jgi:enamine deaminase RidA (YjgF/YER057c/UK114 family)